MYAITFDMVISDLEKYYGKPYNNAYYEPVVHYEMKKTRVVY
ncbi:hypothetical protein PGK51_10440 [Riemerella anatipestifer]|nr:hypothetical protein [Riemerella anatipestifer]